MTSSPQTALEIAKTVVRGSVKAEDVRQAALAAARAAGEPAVPHATEAEERERAANEATALPLNAFTSLLDAADDEGAQAAAAVDATPQADRSSLPLAGVPFAVKNNVTCDSPTIRRLIHAGAVPLGFSTAPEFSVWGATDSATWGITRNPWNRERTAGGSSGGSAAAVAAGLVPFAHGNDGMGSLRIPAACCGLVTLKPGPGLVPTEVGANNWGGMAEDGILATTVADLAAASAVLAGRSAWARRNEPRPLRIAMALNSPVVLGGRAVVRLDRGIRKAVTQTAEVLRAAGHEVISAPLPYPHSPWPVLARWTGGLDADAAAANFPISRMERRNRYHALLGRALRRLDTYAAQRRSVDAVESFMDGRGEGRDGRGVDLVLTPTLATAPLAAEAWHQRSWLRSMWANMRYAPFPALFNHMAWPAMSIPAGNSRVGGTPVGVQLAARPGSEALLLDLAAQLEAAQPWPRIAPAHA